MGLFQGKRPSLGEQGGQLQPCPKSPNCVCSQADSSDAVHAIPPIEMRSDADTAFARLRAVVRATPRTTILEETERYLRAECRTRLLRFTDDLECVRDDQAGVIHIRSASRLGYSDLNANRKRVEDIRSRYFEAEQAATTT